MRKTHGKTRSVNDLHLWKHFKEGNNKSTINQPSFIKRPPSSWRLKHVKTLINDGNCKSPFLYMMFLEHLQVFRYICAIYIYNNYIYIHIYNYIYTISNNSNSQKMERQSVTLLVGFRLSILLGILHYTVGISFFAAWTPHFVIKSSSKWPINKHFSSIWNLLSSLYTG